MDYICILWIDSIEKYVSNEEIEILVGYILMIAIKAMHNKVGWWGWMKLALATLLNILEVIVEYYLIPKNEKICDLLWSTI